MKNSKNYVMSSTATLTQSGLLAVLLQRQRQKAIELARRGTRQEQGGSVFEKWWRALHGSRASLGQKNYRPPHPTGVRGGCSPQNNLYDGQLTGSCKHFYCTTVL
jgi:hypothetical protein